jgi:CBS domain-containing protein
MRAADVMTERVLRVRPDTNVADIVQLLVERQISAVPVVDDDGCLVGIITEGDLMRRREIGTERKPARRSDSTGERTARAASYVKTHGSTAAEVMTPKVLSVAPETPLSEIAEMMERRRIKRVPVVTDGRLVGIVSRLDLVRAIHVSGLRDSPAPLDDAAIKAALTDEIARQGWQLSPGAKLVVFEGVVHLFGAIGSAAERRALVVAARALPGVRSVQDHLEDEELRTRDGEPRIELV